MKITIKPKKSKKLVAVKSATEDGIFLAGIQGTYYLDRDGVFKSHSHMSLENILAENDERIPIYEGDKITLEF